LVQQKKQEDRWNLPSIGHERTEDGPAVHAIMVTRSPSLPFGVFVTVTSIPNMCAMITSTFALMQAIGPDRKRKVP
jgi:hypothetical protein